MSRFIRVTRGAPGIINDEGLEVLRMALWVDGKEVEHVSAYSGAPGKQNFRLLANERRGVLEPCPEGYYRDIGPLEWAGKVGDYKASWDPGLGPVVAQIYGERAIMLHLDANRAWAPGSSGCLCPIDLQGLKTVVAWWTEGVPEHLECDWGLGSIQSPHVLSVRRLWLSYHDDRTGVKVSSGPSVGSLSVDVVGGKLTSVLVNGIPVKPKSVSAEVVF